MRSQERPTAIDLFSGAGGLSLGLERSGFTVLVGADNDATAVETHVGNLGGLGWVGDLASADELLEDLSAWGISSVDLVAGGVPCQPFSRAGQSRLRELVAAGIREAEDPRAGLWRSFLRVVARLEPRAVLVENVPDLPRWNDGVVLTGLLGGLRELGYDVDATVLSAFEHGVPQQRARLFIVGLRGSGQFRWPQAMDHVLTLRDAIADLPPVPGGHTKERIPYLADRLVSDYHRLMRSGLRGESRWFLDDHMTRQVRPDDLEAYQLLQEGQTYADLPSRLQRYRTDIFTDKYKRLAWDQPSRSITAHIAKDGYWYIHPSQHRTLSIREAARVQSFPDDFRFAGQPTHRFRQIGNAVPPLLAQAVGNSLFCALEASPVEEPIGHGESIREPLLDWSESMPEHPWRRTSSDPWHVLLGELLLGRLTAGQAASAFPAVLRVASSPQMIAKAPERTIRQLQSLGMGQRAELLVSIAIELVEQLDGELPPDHLLMQLLPGVGDHLAQAVLCYGFGAVVSLLDTRTARVVSRVVGRDEGGRWQLRLDLHRLAGSDGPDARLNAALLELAATSCRIEKPLCDTCPLVDNCEYGRHNRSPQQPLELAA